jgi:hypothetical protein
MIWLKVYPLLVKLVEDRDKSIKNKKYEIFNSVDIEEVQKKIDDYFESYISTYITYKFISKKINYIKADDIELMVKDITKMIYLEISELYVYYISLVYSLDDDDSLLKYIHKRVQNICIATVSNYNKTM